MSLLIVSQGLDGAEVGAVTSSERLGGMIYLRSGRGGPHLPSGMEQRALALLARAQKDLPGWRGTPNLSPLALGGLGRVEGPRGKMPLPHKLTCEAVNSHCNCHK